MQINQRQTAEFWNVKRKNGTKQHFIMRMYTNIKTVQVKIYWASTNPNLVFATQVRSWPHLPNEMSFEEGVKVIPVLSLNKQRIINWEIVTQICIVKGIINDIVSRVTQIECLSFRLAFLVLWPSFFFLHSLSFHSFCFIFRRNLSSFPNKLC